MTAPGTGRDPRSTLRSVVRRSGAPGDGAWEAASFDRVVVEEPLEIRVGDEPIAVTMRTPGEDEDLAVGFLATEGVLAAPSDVVGVRRLEPNVVEVEVTPGVDARRARRALYSASSCGLCGKETLAAVSLRVRPVEDDLELELSALLAMPEALRAAQPTFDATGGLHAVALFHPRGELEVLREDVGRHNATDKVVGSRLRAGAHAAGRVLLVSGRAGFEIVQKAAVAGVPVVAALSAPSSLATDLADRLGVTLVAFLRPPRASVYTHPRRIRAR